MSELTRIVPPAYAGEVKKNTLNAEQRANCLTIADLLNNEYSTFTWDETQEGEVFWESFYKRIRAIGNGEVL